MPPAFLHHLLERSTTEGNATTIASPGFAGQLRSQWQNPSDILSLLLIIEPEVIQRALAQLSGGWISPVSFSFGWVAYSLRTLITILGDGKLMPEADYRALVITAESGHIRENKSWIIGRLLRDFESSSSMLLPKKGSEKPKKPDPLRISIFEVDTKYQPGLARKDWLWYSGFITILIQLCISIIPWVMYSNWTIFTVTVGGTLLVLIHGSIAQWKEEKWDCPKSGGSTVTITQGNGSRHAMVIIGNKECGLNFEVLATGVGGFSVPLLTKVTIPLLALAWGVLLITVVAMKEHSWFLLAIGLVGMIQNVAVSGAGRSPSASGIHIKHCESITGKKVQEALRSVEEKYEFVGTSLIPIFYPGSMRVSNDQTEFWKGALKKRLGANQYGERVDTLDLKDDSDITVSNAYVGSKIEIPQPQLDNTGHSEKTSTDQEK